MPLFLLPLPPTFPLTSTGCCRRTASSADGHGISSASSPLQRSPHSPATRSVSARNTVGEENCISIDPFIERETTAARRLYRLG